MATQLRTPDHLNEKNNVSEMPTSVDDELKHETIVVVDEEEKAILRKIDLQ
jgi:hypothetical protein